MKNLNVNIRRIILSLVALGLIVGVLTFLWYRSRVLIVVVTNTGDTQVTTISLHYTGGESIVPDLQPRSSFRVPIHPTGESDLQLTFVDSEGNSHSEKIDIYIEPNYTGAIHIYLDAEGEVRWESNIKPY